jgi:hypothetical protein
VTGFHGAVIVLDSEIIEIVSASTNQEAQKV